MLHEISRLNRKKFSRWEVITPDGKSEIITNLTKFCDLNGLDRKNIYSRQKDKGFIFTNLSETCVRKYNYKWTYEWNVTFPDGRVETVENIPAFCQDHGLNPNHVYGRRKSKGFVFTHDKSLKPLEAVVRAPAKAPAPLKWRVWFPAPSERIMEVSNLSAFCRKYGLNVGNASALRKTKGFIFMKIDEDPLGDLLKTREGVCDEIEMVS